MRIHMPPEVADMTVHLFAVAQGDAATAVGTKRLRRRIGHGRHRLAGVGMLGDFHGSWHLLNGAYVTSETAVLPASFKT
jgi:hypothetical protein